MPAPTMQTSQRSTADGSDPDMKLIMWQRRGSAYSDTRLGHVLICGLHGIDAMAAVANTGVVRSVVVLGYPGVQALDLVGPFEVFTGATIYLASQGRADEGYSVGVVSRNGEPATTLTGLTLVAQPLPDPREPIDTLVLPGGIGVDEARRNADTIGWIQIAAEHTRRVVSVCTGSFLAAQTGFIDGCHRGHRPGVVARRGRLRHGRRADGRPLAGALPATAGWADAVRGAGVDAARQASADPRRAGAHQVRTRRRAQYPGVGSSRRNEPSPLHARVHRRGWGSAWSLCRAHPHRSRPPSARGDRRHRYRHRGSLRLRQRGNPQTQLRSTAWHFARPIPQDIRLTEEMAMTQIAIVVYPGFTALDFIGPYEVLRNLPDAEVRFVWHEPGPIAADSGVLLVGATHSFDETPSPDMLLVPGGMTTFEHARDEKLLDWVR